MALKIIRKKKSFISNYSVWLTIIIFLSSCSYFFSKKEEEVPEQEEDYSPNLYDSSTPFPHSKTGSFQDLQNLIFAHKLPELKEIEACKLNLSISVGNTNNEFELVRIKKMITKQIAEKPENYHWCFYSLFQEMNENVEKIGSPLSEKSLVFMNYMTQLWVLSRALKDFFDDDKYFHILQDRYIYISRNIFGRTVQVISLPLDERQKKEEDLDQELKEKQNKDDNTNNNSDISDKSDSSNSEENSSEASDKTEDNSSPDQDSEE